jgi:hypothetical protein
MKLHPKIEYIKSLGWNIKIVPTDMMVDIRHVRRTWKERWFSWPWDPLKDFKEIYEPMAYILDDIWLVSYKTYAILEEELGRKYDQDNTVELKNGK